MRLRATIQEVTFDCADAASQACFWGNLLERPWGWRAEPGGVVDAGTVHLLFQVVPEPKTSPKNRLHLDVEVADLLSDVARAEALGATRVREFVDPDGGGFVVMRDPEANEFCLVAQPSGSWTRLLDAITSDPGIDPLALPPVLAAGRFLLRLVRPDDAEDLLACYGDPAAWPLFNTDNCTSDFRFTTVAEVREAIEFWLADGAANGYVRFSVVDGGVAVGTLEFFGRPADAHNELSWGLLRLDLAPACENADDLGELFAVTGRLFEPFGVERILTRVPAEAVVRTQAALAAGFAPFAWTRPGSTGTYLAKTR